MTKKGIKVFLDSNVILSGLLSARGSPRIILDILSLDLPIISGVTGKYNIIEIERNLKKKMPDVIPVYKKYLPALNLEIVPMPLLKTINELTGQIADKDVPVLASAIMSNADFLVTGDKKDFSKLKAKRNYQFEIMGPSEFLENVVHKILNI